MKPPHGNRPGGSGRPPGGGQGSGRGPGGQSQRPFQHGGGGPRRDHGPRGDAPRHGGENQHQGANRNEATPRGDAPRHESGPYRGPGPARHQGGERRSSEYQGERRNFGPQGERRSFEQGRGRGFDQGERRGDQGGHYRGDGPRHERDQNQRGGHAEGRHDRPRFERGRYEDRPAHHGGPPRPGRDTPQGTVWLYGQHAVAAALANPARRLRRLLLTEEAEATLVTRIAPPWPLQAERVDRNRLDHLLGRDQAHQGAALLADHLPLPSLQQALERPGPIIVLDQVTDPRNVGAILRSAAAFGAAAVVTQDRNAPEETGALAKAASGALETMPLLRAVNIARTLIALKAANVWCVGLDSGSPPLAGASLAGRRIALVLGAEGEGLRRLTRETCDELAGLQMPGASGRLDSLNVSAAAAIALYEVSRAGGGVAT